MGRPSLYTPELAERICQRLAEGESLRAICRDEEMPPESTVRNWVVSDVQGFAAQYARAKEKGCDAIAEEILEISDDGRNDFMEALGDEKAKAYILNGEHVQRSKLRVDARKWYLSKIAPKRYGDKQQVEHSGSLTLEQALADSYKPPGDGG